MTKIPSIPKRLFFVFTWVLYQLINIPVDLLGFIVTPFVYPLRNTPYVELQTRWYWRLIQAWVNPEDWYGQRTANKPEYESLPWWWVKAHGTGFWSFYKYHAIRNPGNGLRSVEWLDCDVDPAKVEYWQDPVDITTWEPKELRAKGVKVAKYWAWQGWQAGWQYVRILSDDRYMVVKLGWRVDPGDAQKDAPTKLDEDTSFASKVLFYRKG